MVVKDKERLDLLVTWLKFEVSNFTTGMPLSQAS